MLHIFSQLRQRLRWETRRTVTGGVGALLVITGVGFAAAAAWSALAPIVGAPGASLILAAVFSGLGLVVISLRGGQDKPPIDSPLAQLKTRPAPKGANAGSRQEMPPLMEAFLFGMTVYLQNQKRKP
ncbi:MAG: hypothetical protein ACXIVL_04020 [Oceanicaulis sp.]